MKIYVGNLPFVAVEEDVRELFVEFGEVKSIAWITDRITGRFRGFVFVEMDDAAGAKAIAGLDGHKVGGRAIRVNAASPRDERNDQRRSHARESSDRGDFGGSARW